MKKTLTCFMCKHFLRHTVSVAKDLKLVAMETKVIVCAYILLYGCLRIVLKSLMIVLKHSVLISTKFEVVAMATSWFLRPKYGLATLHQTYILLVYCLD